MLTFVAYDGSHSWNAHRRGSLEEALYAISPSTVKWSVELVMLDAPPLVVASHEIGIDLAYTPHPSLLARQILATLSLHGDVRVRLDPDDPHRGSVCLVETGTDDPSTLGDTRWSPLPPTPERQSSPNTSRRTPRVRLTQANPDAIRFELDEPTIAAVADSAVVTIHHACGHAKILRRLLELRPVSGGLWDLVVLNQDENGSALSTSKGTYLSGLDSDLYLIASCLGIRTKHRDPAAIPSTWRLGTFEIVDTTNGAPIRRSVLGFIRGPLKHPGVYGIDRRTVEMTYAEGQSWEWKRKEQRWHLTHIGTGLLILHTKRRKSAEEVADRLLREVPELNALREKEEISVELKERARQAVEETRMA